MSIVALAPRPPAWGVLARALNERRRPRARFHGVERVICPLVPGWKAGRAKVLRYQIGGTSHGDLPGDPARGTGAPGTRAGGAQVEPDSQRGQGPRFT